MLLYLDVKQIGLHKFITCITTRVKDVIMDNFYMGN